MKCYRNGGCGPYEMRSCGECPASKEDYFVASTKSALRNNAEHYMTIEGADGLVHLLNNGADAIGALQTYICKLESGITSALDALDRGADNDWARDALENALSKEV